jgi:predicted hydrocarbon binding protein
VSFDLTGSNMIGVSRDALTALRSVLFRDAGGSAANYLYEAGYAGGGALHDAFTRWCRTRQLPVPEAMTAPDFEKRATEFFSELGWGSLRVSVVHDSALALDSTNWAEADPSAGMQFPGCYFSTGMLTHFFARVGSDPVTVMEVECRCMGGERCRFIVASAETVQHVYDAMVNGVSHETALQEMT